LGKIKVYELAKQLGIQNADVIEKLKNMGVEVKSHLSIVDEKVAMSISGKNGEKIKVENDKIEKKVDKKEDKKNEKASQVHIIRRNVKVINTDGQKSEVDQITTNISGNVKKSHTVIDESNNANSYSKEGLGVITPRQGLNRNLNNTRNSNVVVTRNGQKVEPLNNKIEEKKEEDKKNEKGSETLPNEGNAVTTNNPKPQYNQNNPNKGYINNNNSNNSQGTSRPPYNNGYRNNNQNNYNNPNNQGTQGNQNNSNNQGTQRPTYNNGYRNNNNNNTQSNSRPPYNNGYRPNNNAQGDSRPPYNNGYRNNNNTQGDSRPPYNNGYRNNNNAQGDSRPPYNNGYRPNNNTQGDSRPPYNNGYRNNNNTQGDSRPPYNNGYRNNNNSQGGYNNQNSGYNKGSNTSYQVNKFIKQAATLPVETKETKEYNNLPDKKKYSKPPVVEKKDKLDKNKLREERSRVSTTQLKGLEVTAGTGLMDLYERVGDSSRKTGYKKRHQKPRVSLNQTKIIPMTEVKLPEVMSVKEFAEAIKKQSADIIKKLFGLGIMATVNQEIDFDTAYLIAEEFKITAHKQVIVTDEDILFDDSVDEEKDLKPRPPVVVVMGHVDHGKTSLLDKIRCADVVGCEAGGITQHIGAYKVKCNSREICFLDTPGHEAFTAMRARGAQITDIAVIIVAADDGIKPQTIEAIDHAKAAGVSIIVAINKIDKPAANVDKVKQELLQIGLVSEEWGGDTICIPISAMTGEGIENLLEMILLVADMKNLRANPDKQAKGTIIEARLDKNIGTIVSMLVQRGTLNVSDTIVVGNIIGRVRAMKDDKGNRVEFAGPSTPVEIIGLSQVPQTGDIFYEVENEKVAKNLVAKRKAKVRRDLIKEGTKVTLDDLFGQIKEGKVKDLNIIIKADVQGSVEALKESLEKLSNDEVRVRILHASTGGIKQSDVTLASVSNSIIIGFNVRPETSVEIQVKKEKVDMRLYSVIYDAIGDVETALKGLMPKKYKEIMYGTCEVRKIFNITGAGIIAGCYVTKGKMIRNAMVRLVRDSIVIFEIKIDSLKREKDDVKEVAEGYECGIKLEKCSDIKEGDIFECFEMIEEKR
jgi:translation initiation factor IF-2